MTSRKEVLVNARPLRTKIPKAESIDDFEKELEALSCSSASGVVISCTNGIGEVLVAENFEDSGVHFIFTRATCLKYNSEHEPIGVGSVVQIYWSRSFERIIKGAHIIVQIERMEVFKYCTFSKETIFITFNPQTTPGIALGVTERNTCVAIHPNCFPEVRYETFKAQQAQRTEFELKYKQRENTHRMVKVYMAAVPFKIEISGSLDKIPFLAIHKIGDAPGKNGVAVITKMVKNHFLEASFLESSENVYFDSNSCHSNVLDKLSVGSLIDVMASPAFPSSFYKWYGYDVTMCRSYLANAETQKSFQLENNKILGETTENLQKSAKSATMEMKLDAQPEKDLVANKKTAGIMRFNSRLARYKLKHLLFDQCTFFIPEREIRETINSQYIDRLEKRKLPDYYRKTPEIPKSQENVWIPRATYSNSLQNFIKDALGEFGLNKPDIPHMKPDEVHKNQEIPVEKVKSSENHKKPTRKTPQEIRKLLGHLMDSEGNALNQKVQARFDLPDTNWKPTERRYIGIHDDLQWMMMGTFCPVPENPAENRKLAGGWWYRRTVPRDHPVEIVKEMNCRRNIIKDCTESFKP